MGTHILLEAAKIRKITRFIHVSTDEVYGEVINGVRQKATEKKKKKLILLFSQIALRILSCLLLILIPQQKQPLNA
jgi:GDP-D-mannose dehydratase